MPRVKWSAKEKGVETIKQGNKLPKKNNGRFMSKDEMANEAKEAVKICNDIVEVAHEAGCPAEKPLDCFKWVLDQIMMIPAETDKKIANRVNDMMLTSLVLKQNDVGSGDLPPNVVKAFAIYKNMQLKLYAISQEQNKTNSIKPKVWIVRK